MRLREHTAAACLFILIICASASVVAAQEFMQPPFVPPPPGTPSLLCGRFYFQAGVKYRSLESLRFTIKGDPTTTVASQGTIPFGPTTAGDFGFPITNNGFQGAGDIWIYDNGFIASNVITEDTFGVASTSCTEPGTSPPVTNFCATAIPWTFFINNPELGRFPVTGGAQANCCGTTNQPKDIGSFQINDPTTQVNNFNGPISGTTQVTFTRTIDDSLVFTNGRVPDALREMGPQVWSPVFEAGFQLYDFFDLFYGFSWFNVKNSTGNSINFFGNPVARRVIQDTFPFVSDDDSNWAVFAFNSASTETSGTNSPLLNYHITPNSALRGIFPNRQFLTQIDASQTINLQVDSSNKADINVYEFRMGSRTWLPLFGLGRMGAIMGGTFMPAHYKIVGNRSFTSLDTGAVLFALSAEHKDWLYHWGGFVGGDLELGYGSVYVNGSIDYTWVNSQSFQLFDIETSFSPGGMGVAITGGFHF